MFVSKIKLFAYNGSIDGIEFCTNENELKLLVENNIKIIIKK